MVRGQGEKERPGLGLDAFHGLLRRLGKHEQPSHAQWPWKNKGILFWVSEVQGEPLQEKGEKRGAAGQLGK